MNDYGIVFDLDHTLYDRYGTFRALLPELIGRFRDRIDPRLSSEEILSLWCDADRHQNYFGWQKVVDEMHRTGLFLSAPALQEYSEFLLNGFCGVAVPFPFAAPTLAELRKRGYRLGLITNGSPKIQRRKLELLSLTDAFDELLFPYELGMKKPETAPFETMARQIGLPPERLYYVGDHPINDVDASRNAGFTPVWIRTTGTWIDGVEPAPIEADTVAELLTILH